VIDPIRLGDGDGNPLQVHPERVSAVSSRMGTTAIFRRCCHHRFLPRCVARKLR
jgi:hypothetical protein